MRFGHLKIRDDDLDLCCAKHAQCCSTVFGEERLVTRILEERAQEYAIRVVVIDDENTRHSDPTPWSEWDVS